MSGENDARLGQVEQDIADIKLTMAGMPGAVTDIKSTLAQMLPMLIRIVEGQARLEERLAGSLPPAEFHELRGRVEEISRRLPTALAYPQPAQRQS
jgi:hypothetical protein